MTEYERTAAERATAAASRQASVEQHGSLPTGDVEQRSLGDVVNNPVFLMAAGVALDKVADPLINAITNAVKHDPGKHEEPPD